jgi:hypothetical protein
VNCFLSLASNLPISASQVPRIYRCEPPVPGFSSPLLSVEKDAKTPNGCLKLCIILNPIVTMFFPMHTYIYTYM